MRALGDPVSLEDDLPAAPPTFKFKHQVYTVAPEPAFTGELSFGDDESTTETKEKKPEVFDETMTRYTRFSSVTSASKIVERVGEVLKTLGLKFSARESNFKLKIDSGDISFVVQVFTDSKIDDQHVVDFRKVKGPGAEFRSLYQEIRAHLADIVLQPKKVDSSQGSESSKTIEVVEVESS